MVVLHLIGVFHFEKYSVICKASSNVLCKIQYILYHLRFHKADQGLELVMENNLAVDHQDTKHHCSCHRSQFCMQDVYSHADNSTLNKKHTESVILEQCV